MADRIAAALTCAGIAAAGAWVGDAWVAAGIGFTVAMALTALAPLANTNSRPPG